MGTVYIDDLSHKIENLTIQLHALIRIKCGDTEKADNIREQMIDLWRDLSSEKRSFLNNLSGDLFMLIDEEILENGKDILPEDFFKLWDNKNFVSVLAALRNKGLRKILSKADVAYYRGCCLLCIGYIESGFVFLEHFKKLKE